MWFRITIHISSSAASANSQYWKNVQVRLLSEVKKRGPITLTGDRRNDSPGFRAQYCSYTVADVATEAILDIQVVVVREADYKSPCMEMVGFKRAMETVTSKVKVKEVATDQHTSNAASLRKFVVYVDQLLVGLSLSQANNLSMSDEN